MNQHHAFAALVAITFGFCTICSAIIMVMLGYQWLDYGYGLNPIAAFPAAVIFAIAATMTGRVYEFMDNHDHSDD